MHRLWIVGSGSFRLTGALLERGVRELAMTAATRSLPSGQSKLQIQLTERKPLFNLTTERGALPRVEEGGVSNSCGKCLPWGAGYSWRNSSNPEGLTCQGAKAHNRGLARFSGPRRFSESCSVTTGERKSVQRRITRKNQLSCGVKLQRKRAPYGSQGRPAVSAQTHLCDY